MATARVGVASVPKTVYVEEKTVTLEMSERQAQVLQALLYNLSCDSAEIKRLLVKNPSGDKALYQALLEITPNVRYTFDTPEVIVFPTSSVVEMAWRD